MPKGKIENSVPTEMSSSPNLALSCGTTDPKVVMAIPKNKIPIQAAQKTSLLLYVFTIDFFKYFEATS